MKHPTQRTQSLIFFFVCVAFFSGCGFYFKTYKFKGNTPFFPGMTQEEVLNQWGSPLSVQVASPQQVWRYFSQEPVYGKKKSYYLVWFREGKVVKWVQTEEENFPPLPAA